MREIVIPSLYLLTGVMAYAMAHHFIVALKPPHDRAHLTFAVMCLLAVAYILSDIQALQASGTTDYISALKWNISAALLFFLLFPWFIASHTGKPYRPLLTGLSLLFAILCVVNLAQPYSLLYDRLDGLNTLQLPWGETIVRGDGHNGAAAYLGIAAIMAAFGYALYTLGGTYRRHRRGMDLVMLIAVSLFLLSSVEDLLVRLSVLPFIELGPYSLPLMAISMSAALSYGAQQQLRNSERRFRMLFENSPVCIHEISLDGRFLSMNRAGLDMLGQQNEGRVCGMSFLNVVSGQDAQRIQALFQEALAGKVCHFEFTTAGDMPLYFKSSFIPIRDTAGQVIKLMGLTEDITERKRAEQNIQQLAYYDPLTNLPNRRLLLDRLGQALSACNRSQRHGALMLIDLDHFKKLNDLHGHEVGDLLLIEVAQRITRCIREQDSAARLGGDEYVVMLEALSTDMQEAARQAGMVAEKIRSALSRPYRLQRTSISGETGAIEHYCSSSIGVTLFGSGDNFEELFRWTDAAMYQAKAAGRNIIRFFDATMQAAIEAHTMLEQDLRSAYAEQQFRLHYQLQFDGRRTPQGAEALLRWEHPHHGLIAPLRFIRLAEETGLILLLGQWVLDTACAQIRKWQDNPLLRKLAISVNVSSKQFRQPDFVSQIRATVQHHGINPLHLKLELTESVVLENIEDAVGKMLELKEFGVRIALDDFGTGYSSLAYLKRLPVDQLKIDQSFVRDIATDTGDVVMVRTIVDLGMNFELGIVAEGVETEEQFRLLQRYGCSSFQGFLLGKPAPAEQLETALR